jgi:hypothetical protein
MSCQYRTPAPLIRLPCGAKATLYFNYRSMERFRHHVGNLWFLALKRRSQRAKRDPSEPPVQNWTNEIHILRAVRARNDHRLVCRTAWSGPTPNRRAPAGSAPVLTQGIYPRAKPQPAPFRMMCAELATRWAEVHPCVTRKGVRSMLAPDDPILATVTVTEIIHQLFAEHLKALVADVANQATDRLAAKSKPAGARLQVKAAPRRPRPRGWSTMPAPGPPRS